MLSAAVKKRFAQSDESQAGGRWIKKLFDFPRVDVPLTTNHLIDTSTTVSPHYFLALPPVLHTTKPAHLMWMIEENMKQ